LVAFGLAAILAAASGCGNGEREAAKLRELNERHRKEIAALNAERKAAADQYEKRLQWYEGEINRLKAKLVATNETLNKERAAAKNAGGPANSAGAKPGKAASSPEAAEGSSPSPANPVPEGAGVKLEDFENSHAALLDPALGEQFKKEMAAYMARLNPPAAPIPLQKRKEMMLADVQAELDATPDEREKELLQRKAEKIQDASEEDLAGVLDYYQDLENNRTLDELMERYGISRNELVEYGIAPPPMTYRGADTVEAAYNVRKFMEKYEPLTDSGVREQYVKDFNDYLSRLSQSPTEAEITQRRDEMILNLQQRRSSASGRYAERLERRIQSLQEGNVRSVSRRIQSEKIREINDLAQKYGIPANELRQSGIRVRNYNP